MAVVFFGRQLPMALDSASLVVRRNVLPIQQTARLRVTGRNAEIIDLNAYRELRSVAAVPVGPAGLVSVQGQTNPSPFVLGVVLACVFWSTWVFGPFFVTTKDEGGHSARWAK